ncbi:hypothetical protein [Nocardioides baculatus]|uniref:GAF domain-containing protein n=1 Tax=Nocardioides baculatus TaxID=2801337 RepID=A0ABS1LDL1_9ACTN|nr:hypothetical protein [Nocardioides baculatus]MBL0749786.1 hypothetical protein [Nocardioides baculatus]
MADRALEKSGAGDNDAPRSDGGSSAPALLAWLKVEWHQPTLAFGAAVGLVSSAATGLTMAVLIAISVSATVLGSLRVFKRHSDVMTLTERLGTANDRVFELERELAGTQNLMKEMLWALLTLVRDEMQMGYDERISVYVHLEDLRAFQMLGRSSLNPDLARAGRTVYEDSVGVIGKTWTVKSEVVEGDLPPWSGDGRSYVAENMARFGLPEDKCRRLNMKSRSLIGVRYPADTAGSRPVGVLILESNSPDWATEARLEQLKQSTSWATLQAYLHSQRDELPLMSGAKGKGF